MGLFVVVVVDDVDDVSKNEEGWRALGTAEVYKDVSIHMKSRFAIYVHVMKCEKCTS